MEIRPFKIELSFNTSVNSIVEVNKKLATDTERNWLLLLEEDWLKELLENVESDDTKKAIVFAA